MTTSRRLGLLSGSSVDANSLAENYDTFKRKHVSQNREIIHKNSELMKTNAHLDQRVRELQSDFMTLKGENLRLSGHNFQLEQRISALEEALRCETDKNLAITYGGLSPENHELLRYALEQAMRGVQSAQSVINGNIDNTDTTPRVPRDKVRIEPDFKDPYDTTSQDNNSETRTSTLETQIREKPERRYTLSAQPDLSFIPEVEADLEPREFDEISQSIENDPTQTPPCTSPLPSSPTPTQLSSPSMEVPTNLINVRNRRSSGIVPSAPSLGMNSTHPKIKGKQTEKADHHQNNQSNGVNVSQGGVESTMSKEPLDVAESLDDDAPSQSSAASYVTQTRKRKSTPSHTTTTNSAFRESKRTRQTVDAETYETGKVTKHTATTNQEPPDSAKTEKHPDSQDDRPMRDVTLRKNNTRTMSADIKKRDRQKEEEEEPIVSSEKENKETVEEEEQSEEEGAQKPRRARKSVSYALPNLNSKMRQPEGYVSTIRPTTSQIHSTRRNSGTHTSGTRPRKSSVAPGSKGRRHSNGEDRDEDDQVDSKDQVRSVSA